MMHIESDEPRSKRNILIRILVQYVPEIITDSKHQKYIKMFEKPLKSAYWFSDVALLTPSESGT